MLRACREGVCHAVPLFEDITRKAFASLQRKSGWCQFIPSSSYPNPESRQDDFEAVCESCINKRYTALDNKITSVDLNAVSVYQFVRIGVRVWLAAVVGRHIPQIIQTGRQNQLRIIARWLAAGKSPWVGFSALLPVVWGRVVLQAKSASLSHWLAAMPFAEKRRTSPSPQVGGDNKNCLLLSLLFESRFRGLINWLYRHGRWSSQRGAMRSRSQLFYIG